MRIDCARQLNVPTSWKGPLKLTAGLIVCLVLLAVATAMQSRQGRADVTDPPQEPAEMAASSQPAATQPAATTQPTTKPADSGEYLFARRSKDPLHTRPDSGSGVMSRMLVMVIVILVIGGVVLLLIRRYRPRTRPGKPGRRIELLETSVLGPGKAIHLFRIGRREVLLGVTKERISMLTELASPAQDAPADGSFQRALDAAEEADE